MWIATVHGFVSLVQDREDPDTMQVRARDPQDIEAMFPRARVFTAPGADYQHRARIDRSEIAEALHAAVLAIDYTSHFKDVALDTSPPNAQRSRAMYGCWEALAAMQACPPYSTTPRSVRTQWEDDDWDEEDL